MPGATRLGQFQKAAELELAQDAPAGKQVTPKNYLLQNAKPSGFGQQLFQENQAMLYADPGSGILIWQMLLALFIGATFYFSKVRTWVAAKLRPARHEVSESIAKTAIAPSVSEVE